MELFSEIYGTYYKAIRHLLIEASKRPLSAQDVYRVLAENSFSESAYYILPKLQKGDWPLLKGMGNEYAAVCEPQSAQPLTQLQLSWLKSIDNDPRIRLFLDNAEITELQNALANMPLLFHPNDFHIYDKARDGDNYDDEKYCKHFRVFLTAINEHLPVALQYESGHGRRVSGTFWPSKLEFSAKDDKFRVLCYRKAMRRTMPFVLNLSRVTSAQLKEINADNAIETQNYVPGPKFREVVFEITRERNALERCMVQFAHFEKSTEYNESTNRYKCSVKYNVMDETELVIKVLSFGPTIKVLEPQIFLDEIKCRVKKQHLLDSSI